MERKTKTNITYYNRKSRRKSAEFTGISLVSGEQVKCQKVNKKYSKIFKHRKQK